MNPNIRNLSEKNLIGMRMKMSLAADRTAELCGGFMPRRFEIRGAVSNELYLLRIYNATYFEHFEPGAGFEKWITIEVPEIADVPEGMESFILPAGLYAVFFYRGKSSEGADTYQYIYGTWLPVSDYELDQRPHFEILGNRYRNEDPDSEEQIWVPIRLKE